MTMTNEQEKDLENAVNRAIEDETVKQFPTRHATATLTSQWETLTRYDAELRDRVRRERLEIIAEYEKLVTETHADFARRIDDAVTGLEKARKRALRLLRDQAQEKMREHELLTERMS